MITVETLEKCSKLDSITLQSLLRKHYPQDRVLNSKFVGISNAREFVYSITYPYEGIPHNSGKTKVFVTYLPNGELVADY